jgi:signal transduction histidine kinase
VKEPGRGADSAFALSAFVETVEARGSRWIGWRRRLLTLAALAGCLTVFVLARWLMATPAIDATWVAADGGRVMLQTSPLPALQAQQGRVLQAVAAPGETPLAVDSALLHRSPRWQVDDAARQRQIVQHQTLALALRQGAVELHFEGGQLVVVAAQARGWWGLGLMFWPLATLALVLMLFGVVVLLARPAARQRLFFVMALCQAANLLFITIETTRGLGLPLGAGVIDLPLRLALDLATGAAGVHAFLLRPSPGRRWSSAWVWLVLPLGSAGALLGWPAPTWWFAQLLCLGLAFAAWAALRPGTGEQPDALALVLRRLCLLALATLVLVTAAVAAAARLPGLAHGVAAGASVAWYLFLASLLLLSPFLARSRQLLREFALLAGISTVAASVDLLFVAVFSVGAFTSLAVAVFVALAVYAGARQLILQQLLGASLLTTERTFELLYRAAREVQAQPAMHAHTLAQLLADLFEPLAQQLVNRVPRASRVLGGGVALVVPLRAADDEVPAALLLRHAQRGQRLFTLEDARLADRMVDQLRRALAYDQAVERGRSEERQRLAQDLHDDIGARLLTLMYQAPTPELEDYIRHTLQDLKTLTRGLAAGEHKLSEAAAEWKADLAQRLSVAQVELTWSLGAGHDPMLSVVQWSALTRVLRELVTNALYHGHANRIEVSLQLQGPALKLIVGDDGEGQAPETWAHGLGLGGIRKRVKLLGGQVAWRKQAPQGIVCEVLIPGFAPGA